MNEDLMGDLNVSPEIQKNIINQLIGDVSNTIYAAVIQRRVAARVEDKETITRLDKVLETLEKKLIEFKKELSNVKG